MQFSFGIITNNGSNLDLILNSIIKQIPEKDFEVIIVGNCSFNTIHKNIKQIDFDESIKPAWITKKKNIITENASFENIVYMHDYMIIGDDWYSEFIKFGNNWDVCINPIINLDNTRFRDLTVFPFYSELPYGNDSHLSNFTKEDLFTMVPGMEKFECLIPYDIDEKAIDFLHRWQYISGAYWVAKKHVMIEFKLNEDLIWCQGEDLEWSERIKNKYKISFNKNSSVRLLKQKEVIFKSFSNNTLEFIKKNYI